MESKTQNFDKLMDEILYDLVPHTRKCKFKNENSYCEREFNINLNDIIFLKMFRVPAPLYCPTCRRQKRFAFINQISLYKRLNNAPGTKNKIISYVPPASKLTVYDVKNYQEVFDPFSYGTIYNPNKSFHDQFFELRLKVPQPAIIRDSSSVNSEYSINGKNLKNGYYVSGGWNSEDVLYSVAIFNSRSVMDCFILKDVENSYESVSSEKCFNCSYLYFSDNCIDSRFLYDCNNCIDCFGCVNLRNKRYYVFNKQLSKEEYEKRLDLLNLSSRNSINEISKKFWEFVKSQPVRASRHEKVENVSGVNIECSKNCNDCIYVLESENLLHCDQNVNNKDSMDVTVSGDSEKLYQTAGVGSKCSNVKFSFASKFITDSEFLINCRNCSNCFACIGLENKNYCIFNTLYEPEEYFKELDKIKSSLIKKGEYGEFFEFSMSTFAYNGSQADFSFPMSEEEIINLGALLQPSLEIDTNNMEVLFSDGIPDDTNQTEDSILTKALICEETKRPFRIVNSEFLFYKRHKIPLPRIHPYMRMKHRFNYVGNYRIYRTKCKLCEKSINTMYYPSNNWCLYCDECYKKELL